ncbi:hypothetical protein [Stakelama marina]|uniref:Uncharacterized protein n=1 Tax=Stakelama marina TaxID=2826939 RepID=A0A8T4IAN8_9SPHN|nr:hypothetical protein [Stakelama marina]MBR0550884.1 hypothetical protein [Stakelama marina]
MALSHDDDGYHLALAGMPEKSIELMNIGPGVALDKVVFPKQASEIALVEYRAGTGDPATAFRAVI